MGSLAKNLITTALIFSAVCVANFSSASVCGENLSCEKKIFATSDNLDENNSEFWEKFRESVMPDDKDKGKIPNYEKNPPPPKPSRNKAM